MEFQAYIITLKILNETNLDLNVKLKDMLNTDFLLFFTQKTFLENLFILLDQRKNFKISHHIIQVFPQSVLVCFG